jgi:hypothetical protein
MEYYIKWTGPSRNPIQTPRDLDLCLDLRLGTTVLEAVQKGQILLLLGVEANTSTTQSVAQSLCITDPYEHLY